MQQTSDKLIMFDGPDGVGKSTQLELAATALRDAGHQVYTSHMLGGSQIGDALRAIVFSDLTRPALANLHINLAIYYALLEIVNQQRSEGRVVLIDRSPLSLVAYQVYGDGLDEAIGLQACQEALEAFRPDKLLIYEAPLETLQDRRQAQQGTKASDYFESQKLAYHQRTTEGYREAAQYFETTVLSTTGTIDEIHHDTMVVIDQLFTE